MKLLLFGNLGLGEILIIALIILLLFGAKKIPELMHGMGKGVKSFKDGINGIENPSDKKQSDPTNTSHIDTKDNTSNV